MANPQFDFENALKYTNAKWKRMLIPFQNLTISKTFNNIKRDTLKNGIKVSFQGKDLNFKCLSEEELNFSWEFKDLGASNLSGYFRPEDNKIYLNTALRNDGLTIFETIYHESVHALQFALAKHRDDYDKDSLEFKYLTLIDAENSHAEVQLEAFGEKFNGEAYVSADRLSAISNSNLAFSFYALQVCERNAMSTGDEAYNYVFNLNSVKSKNIPPQFLAKTRQNHEANMIRRKYNAPGLTYDEICILVDKAKLNIITGSAPTQNNDIEAMITYDIMTLLNAQSLDKDINLAREKFKLLSDQTNRQNALMNAYGKDGLRFIDDVQKRVSDTVILNQLSVVGNFDAYRLSLLDVEMQRMNPKLIISALFFSGKEAISAIKDIKFFKEWYYSNANNLTEEMQNLVAGLLGPEFSPEVRKIKNQEFNQNFLKKHPEYSKGLDHENEDCHVQKYRLNEKYDVPPWEPTQKNELKNKSAIEPEI